MTMGNSGSKGLTTDDKLHGTTQNKSSVWLTSGGFHKNLGKINFMIENCPNFDFTCYYGRWGVVRVHVSFREKLSFFFFYMSRPPRKVRVTSSDQVRFFYRGRFIIDLSNAILLLF